ncbi:ATP-binding cassette domain-containing protein [Psychromonas sp. MB-3u-54]|uniref:ATP-binding cassette domain-containing protein n=1 Tax=Psychromonas sp. MB-3u-54 TaxID=2058319 RepID=UPI00267D1DF5
MLNINNVHAEIQGNTILKGLNLSVKSGEIHAIMDPNGSGKSPLANVFARVNHTLRAIRHRS